MISFQIMYFHIVYEGGRRTYEDGGAGKNSLF